MVLPLLPPIYPSASSCFMTEASGVSSENLGSDEYKVRPCVYQASHSEERCLTIDCLFRSGLFVSRIDEERQLALTCSPLLNPISGWYPNRC